MNSLLCPPSRSSKRSAHSLHSAYDREVGKENFKDLQEEDLKTESENEEDVNESQTWINTDSFGNVFTHEGSNLFLRLGALRESQLFIE